MKYILILHSLMLPEDTYPDVVTIGLYDSHKECIAAGKQEIAKYKFDVNFDCLEKNVP